ncbi:DUF86 domain-containing protein [Thermoleptolyngbya oregonensis]|uniref:HepT-like ribonuclease domain-containing protein n=1 Tax=Thermoleptolyngbya oregonensis TaxID=2303529 RepID=UPI003B3A8DD2
MGEAAANVSQEKQDQYPQIEWRKIIGMRNRIVHAYFDIDMEVVWQTINQDIPVLVSQLEAVFRQEGIRL